ncbi:hypothetical protein M3Y99_00712700 [Aphelenchoides fujianensis]|nr:hypothetical protein M3Y99_00712700 [Aphelenchoides fujianensis]
MGGGQTLRISLLLLCLVHLGLSAAVRALAPFPPLIQSLQIQKRATTTALREGCFPRPGEKAGCRCTTKDPNGHDVTKILETDAECAIKHDPQQIDNKKAVLEELKTDVANLKDGCYPRPSNIGCRCTEKDADGHDVAKIYETDAECRTDAEPVERKKRDEEAVGHHEGEQQKRRPPLTSFTCR